MGLNDQWMQRDLKVLWHPCTQMKDHEQLPLIPIKRGEGVWLEDFEGKRYLDAVSSWWTNLFGHAEPRIGGAIAAQATQLEQVMLAGFGHEPAITLAERLLALAEAAPIKELEEVSLAEAEGRVLATDLVASLDLPPWPNSAMDGYALRLADNWASRCRSASGFSPATLPSRCSLAPARGSSPARHCPPVPIASRCRKTPRCSKTAGCASSSPCSSTRTFARKARKPARASR